MASDGPNYPAAAVNDAAFGSLSWSNPGNAVSSDNSDALATAESGNTKYLKATDFSMSIPGGATIDGIVVEVEKASQEGCVDARARIVKGGAIGSTDRSLVGNWPASDTFRTHGGTSDLWGESWSSSDFGSDFGFAIAATINGDPGAAIVDSIRITVHYTATAAAADPAVAFAANF